MSFVAGLPILVPSFGNLPGAFQQQSAFEVKDANWSYSHYAGGGFLEVPLVVNFNVLTSATPATRFADLRLYDASGNILWEVLSTLGQGTSSNLSYVWWATLGAAGSSAGTAAMTPFPPTIMQAGYRLRAIPANTPGDDNITVPQLTSLLIPTQTNPAAEAPAAAPVIETPVLA